MAEVRGTAPRCPDLYLLCFVCAGMYNALSPHIKARLHVFKSPHPCEQAALAALLSWCVWAPPRKGILCMAGNNGLRSGGIPDPVVFITGFLTAKQRAAPAKLSGFLLLLCLCGWGRRAADQNSPPVAGLVPFHGPCSDPSACRHPRAARSYSLPKSSSLNKQRSCAYNEPVMFRPVICAKQSTKAKRHAKLPTVNIQAAKVYRKPANGTWACFSSH